MWHSITLQINVSILNCDISLRLHINYKACKFLAHLQEKSNLCTA